MMHGETPSTVNRLKPFATMNRRQFAAGAGAMLAAASLPPAAMPAAASLPPAAMPAGRNLPAHLVFDARLIGTGTSMPFGRIITVAQHPFEGDVTALWQDILLPLWAEGRTATLGYTRHAEFFVLSTLAGEQGYAVTDEQQLEGGRCWWRIRPREQLG